MGRVALIGANGQLGSDIVRLWPHSTLAAAGEELVPLTHADLDVTNHAQVRSVLEGMEPSLVINTAAYHRVDDIERDASPAFAVNAVAVMHLAEACRHLRCQLVHFSTDYVFDGAASEPYPEDHPVAPINAYGVSKAAGEQVLRYLLPRDHIIVRSSGLYGLAGASGKGGNFVETMLRRAGEGLPLRVVADQVSCPTYTLDLAATVLQLIARGGEGTYHVTNAGQCSWYEFAACIFRLCGLEPDLAPITSEEYGAPARRPAYSVLANTRLRELAIEQPRPWEEALAEYLLIKGRLVS